MPLGLQLATAGFDATKMKPVVGVSENKGGKTLLIIALFLVLAYFTVQWVNESNYAENNLTQNDLQLCADNDIYGTAECLLFVKETKQKDKNTEIVTLKYVEDLFNNGG